MAKTILLRRCQISRIPCPQWTHRKPKCLFSTAQQNSRPKSRNGAAPPHEAELLFAVENTAAFVENKLKEFGVDEIVTGIGRTGVVGLIRGNLGEGRTIGMRADMDALPMTETSGKPWASTTSGKMHALRP